MTGILAAMAGSGGDRLLIGNDSATSIIPGGSATASYSLTSAGDIVKTVSDNSTSDKGDWLIPKANAGLYEVQATVTAGSLTSGPTGSFVALTSNRTWTRTAFGIDAVTTLTLDIRRTGTSFTLKSVSLTLNALGSS